jgi:hypothetical protein
LPDSSTLDHHLEFIKETFDKEDERRTSLEGKAGQLLGQAGLVLSLVSIPRRSLPIVWRSCRSPCSSW